MKYKHSIKDIHKKTGLEIPFIRKCVKTMPEIFKNECIRSDKNKILFSDNVYIIFDHIRQFKEDLLTVKDMQSRLCSINNTKIETKDIQEPELNIKKKSSSQSNLELLLAEKDRRIEDLKAENEYLKRRLLTYDNKPADKQSQGSTNPIQSILKGIFGRYY
jgi:hypothetical protein